MYSASSLDCLRVDIYEHNVLADARGMESLRQVILWRLRCIDGKWDYYCVDWRVSTKCDRPERINGIWQGMFDGQRVRAKLYIETWTFHDWEVIDRARLPANKRK